MLEWIGLALVGLTGNWRGYRMGGKAIGDHNMSTDLKKKFEQARAAGDMGKARSIADKAQQAKEDKKAASAKPMEPTYKDVPDLFEKGDWSSIHKVMGNSPNNAALSSSDLTRLGYMLNLSQSNIKKVSNEANKIAKEKNQGKAQPFVSNDDFAAAYKQVFSKAKSDSQYSAFLKKGVKAAESRIAKGTQTDNDLAITGLKKEIEKLDKIQKTKNWGSGQGYQAQRKAMVKRMEDLIRKQ
jgi:hypothetical protein